MNAKMDPTHFTRISDASRTKMTPQVIHSMAARTVMAMLLYWGGPVAYAQWENADNEYAYDGFLEAYEDIMVSAVEVGRIEEVAVKVGERVEAGQQVARLEDASQVIAVQIAKLQSEMHGELDAAQTECVTQTRRVEQLRTLTAKGNARPDELNRAETDLLVARAKMLAAQEDQALKHLEWQRQEIMLERRRIVTPVAGVIAEVRCRRGEYLSPGDAAVVRVVAKDKLLAIFNLPAPSAMGLRVGQAIAVRPLASARVVDGVVYSIAPAIDSESGTVAVRILIENSDESLYPGDRCILPSLASAPQQARQATRSSVK